MTTNHKDKLDPALLRPGRSDLHVLLNNASEKQIKEMFLRFFPGAENEAEEFIKNVPVGKVSMAKLQGHLLQFRDDTKKCVEKAFLISKVDDSANKSMSIDEWLHRLNLLQLQPKFDKQKIRRVNDLSLI